MEAKYKIAEAIQNTLTDLSVPQPMIDTAIEIVPKKSLGLLIYGSRARQDNSNDSDLDLLALVEKKTNGITHDLVSVSCYTSSQLKTGIGTLFGAHLRTDGKIIYDPEKTLSKLINNMGEVNPQILLNRIYRLSCVLDVSDEELQNHLAGLTREARFLLRSALYCEAIQAGEPCFSVAEIAERKNDKTLTALLSSRPKQPATLDEFKRLCKLLSEVLSRKLPSNPYSSLDALIVNSYKKDPELYSVGILARGHSTPSDPYEEIDKVLL